MHSQRRLRGVSVESPFAENSNALRLYVDCTETAVRIIRSGVAFIKSPNCESSITFSNYALLKIDFLIVIMLIITLQSCSLRLRFVANAVLNANILETIIIHLLDSRYFLQKV